MQSKEKYWNISEETGKFLAFLVKITNSKNILEIGTSNGYSATWLIKNADSLTTIEQRDDWYKEAKENLKGLNIKIIKGNALEIIPKLKDKFDLVFIDAKKREYLQYFNLIKPLLKQNAIIIADNTTSHKEKLKDFLEEIKHYNTIELNLGKGLTITLNNTLLNNNTNMTR